MHSTIVSLKVYDDAHKLKMEMQDEMMYLSGLYTYEAVSVAIANAMRKKGSKPIEYRKEPILQSMKQPTEEDIERKRKEFVAKMGVLMANFKKDKDNG